MENKTVNRISDIMGGRVLYEALQKPEKLEEEQVEFDPIKANNLMDYHNRKNARNHHWLSVHRVAAKAFKNSLDYHENGEHKLALSHYKHGLKVSKKAEYYSAKLKRGA